MTAILDTPLAAEPPAEDDEQVSCDGCPETFRRTEMRDRAGWLLCPDCTHGHDARVDRRLTRQLAYAH